MELDETVAMKKNVELAEKHRSPHIWFLSILCTHPDCRFLSSYDVRRDRTFMHLFSIISEISCSESTMVTDCFQG
jgi:hypothetical protein